MSGAVHKILTGKMADCQEKKGAKVHMFKVQLRMLALVLITAGYIFAINYALSLHDPPLVSCPFIATGLIMTILLFVAVSPLGNALVILSRYAACYAPSDRPWRHDPAAARRIELSWKNVCRRAGLPEDRYELYIVSCGWYNPWVVGDTVYVPEGLGLYREKLVYDILLHEVGHLTGGHGRHVVFMDVMSMFFQLTLTMLELIRIFLGVFSRIAIIGLILIPIYVAIELTEIFLKGIWEWIYRGISWHNEYAADRYAVRHGAWDGLREFLNLCANYPTTTHPSPGDRYKLMCQVRDAIIQGGGRA